MPKVKKVIVIIVNITGMWVMHIEASRCVEVRVTYKLTHHTKEVIIIVPTIMDILSIPMESRILVIMLNMAPTESQ